MNTGILMMLLSSIRGLGRVERKTRLVLWGRYNLHCIPIDDPVGCALTTPF